MKFSGPDSLPAPWQNQSVPSIVLPAGDPGVLSVGTPPVKRDPRETQTIVFGFKIPESIEDIMNQGGSVAGFSAVSSFLGCPERSRLRNLGVIRRPKSSGYIIEGMEELNELEYGSLIHALVATRIVYGMEVAEKALAFWNIHAEDNRRAIELIRTYDREFPLDHEPFKVIGVECEVFTDIGDGHGGSIVRSVRYDTVVQYQRAGSTPVCYSLENKTAAKGGTSVADQYMPQFSSQVTLWNSNPGLVNQFGAMVGVIPNMLLKTAVPRAERYAPRYISRFLQHRITSYLRLPEAIQYPIQPDGASPRMFHSCYGRYRPCDFINLCWEGAVGDYEQVQR